jgi:hypothetical protein
MKNKFTRFIQTGILLCSLAFQSAVFAEDSKYNAGELIALGQKAVAKVIENAQNDGPLELSNSKSKPFWEAVKQINDSLAEAEKFLAKQDNEMFTALATAVAASQQAEIAILMIAGVSDQVKYSMAIAATIITRLDEKYSKEASRLANGGKLSETELKQLEKLKSQQKELLEKLDAMEKTVAKNNSEMTKSIKKIRGNSNQIYNAGHSPVDFCNAMFAARFISGAIWGWHHWWGPWGYWGPGFVNINIFVWDTWADYYIYDWALAEDTVDAIEISEDLEDLEFISDLEDVSTESADEWIDEVEFEVDEEDLIELTSDLDAAGWDEVDTDIGMEVMQGYESNFDHSPFEQEFEMEIFDDMGGFDDFGGAFD